MNQSKFIDKLKELNIDYTKEMLDELEKYCNYLMEYNEHTNLTAIRNKEDIYLKHFYDSLMITRTVDLKNFTTLLDIGSGAGFPGIVLKIFFPNLSVTILDSNNKKTAFVESLVKLLGLNNVTVVNDRAEDYAKKGLKFDLVTSRAVAYVDIITTLSSYYVDKNGYILLMKGDISEEKNILDNHLKELNIDSYEVYNCDLDSDNVRNIIKLRINNDNIKLLNYPQILKRHEKWTSK